MNFGNWTVIGEAGRSPSRKRLVLAQCTCGLRKTVQLGNLRSGRSTQCQSCARKGKPSNRKTHGEAVEKPPEYRIWRGIKYRCDNPSNKDWKNYGGIGVTVCSRWRGARGYQNFLKDMGRRPTPGHSIDRIDPHGGYTPRNCRWATPKEQSNNKRK